MRLTNFTRIFLVACCALIVALFGVSPSLAVTPQGNITATSSPNYSKVTTAQYKVLLTKFTPEEIVAINEISSQSEISELVMIMQDPASLSVTTSSHFGTVGVYAAPNGCSFSPDKWGRANFKPACDQHDLCYASKTDRYNCDRQLYARLLITCNQAYPNDVIRGKACRGISAEYFSVVRAVGWSFYKGSGKNN